MRDRFEKAVHHRNAPGRAGIDRSSLLQLPRTFEGRERDDVRTELLVSSNLSQISRHKSENRSQSSLAGLSWSVDARLAANLLQAPRLVESEFPLPPIAPPAPSRFGGGPYLPPNPWES